MMNSGRTVKRKRKESLDTERFFQSLNASSFDDLKKSLNTLNNMLEPIVYNGNRRLTRETLRKLNKHNAAGLSNKESSSRNSVIIINDSDSERNSENDNDTSLSVAECSSKTSLHLRQISRRKKSEKLLKRRETPQKKNRSSVILIDNDSPAINSSSVQESALNEENIAPPKTEDDVVELWSCLRKKYKKHTPKKHSCKINKKMGFVIDTTPDFRNLECLTETEPVWKKRKLHRNLNKAKKLSLSEFLIVPSEHSIENQEIEEHNHNNSLDANIKPSKAQFNRKNTKKIKSEKRSQNLKHKLREIVIDGCNVAMAHTNGKEFSEKGIQLVIHYFMEKGHVVKVFLPQHVRRKEYLILEKLYKEGIVVFTPSRHIDGRRITSYEDRYILDYATKCKGIVISSDQYRDLYKEKPEWRDTIRNRLLMPTFVGDYIMFPEDPLGKYGPKLKTFLQH